MSDQAIDRVSFKVDGMGCGGCAAGISHLLQQAPGIKTVDVSFEESRATIEFDPQVTNAETLGELIREDGYTVAPLTS